MKKRFLSMLIVTVICVSMVGCGKFAGNSAQNKNKPNQTESKKEVSKGNQIKYNEMGLEYYEPEAWKDAVSPICVAGGKFGIAYIVGEIPYEFASKEFVKVMMKKVENAKSEDEQKKLFEEYKTKAKEFFTIIVLDKSKEKDGPKEDIERKEKAFSQYKHKEKVAEKDSLECYILYNDSYDETGLSDSEKKEFKEVIGHLDELKKSVKVFTPVDKMEKMAEHKNIEFKTKSLDGKEIDSSILKDKKLTMINIWATYCGPCIGEMADLQKLYEEVQKENVNVIGVVSDTVDDEENQELAKKILKEKGATFTNIIPDEKLTNGILKDIPGVPTTIFVDSKGNIIGEPIVGSNSKENYKKEIENRLEKLK